MDDVTKFLFLAMPTFMPSFDDDEWSGRYIVLSLTLTNLSNQVRKV